VRLEDVGERLVGAEVDGVDALVVFERGEDLVDDGGLADRQKHLGSVSSDRPHSGRVSAGEYNGVHTRTC